MDKKSYCLLCRCFLGLVLYLYILSCTSCAYRLGFTSEALPGGYRQVAIPIFENKTQIVGVEAYFTNALLREFRRSKGVRVQPNPSLSPLVIEASVGYIDWRSSAVATGVGTFKSERSAPFLPPQTLLTTEYRVKAQVKLRLKRRSDDQILWEGEVKHEKAYPAPQLGLETVNTSNSIYNHSAQVIILQEMAKEMMSEAHQRMRERF